MAPSKLRIGNQTLTAATTRGLSKAPNTASATSARGHAAFTAAMGSIEDGAIDALFGAPCISVDGLRWEDGISAETAIPLTDALQSVVEDLARWADSLH
jgi:hypothetical protein